MEISYFENIYQSKDGSITTVQDFVDKVKHGYWSELAGKIKAESDKKKRNSLKEKLPYVTISGKFGHRKKDDLIKHSGFICMDFDDLEDPLASFEKFKNDPFSFAVFRSVSGRGIAVIVKIDGRRHLDAYLGLETYYASKYQEFADRMCKDVTRPRYASFDPDTWSNPSSEKFAIYLPKSETTKKLPAVITGRADMDYLIEQVHRHKIDLTQSSYFRFLEIGFALAEEFKEEGREYFHQIAQFSEKYSFERAEKQFNNCLKAGGQGITLATLLFYAKNAGLSIISPETKHIVTVAAMGKKAGRTIVDTIELLEKVDGITKEQSEEIIEKTYAHEEVGVASRLSNLESLEIFLHSYYNLKRNEVTRFIQNNGEEIDTNFMNSIYIRARKEIDDKIKHDEIDRLINSDFTPAFNPLKEFFQANAALVPSCGIEELNRSGCIIDLANAIDTDTGISYGVFYPDYKYRFLRKWIVSIVAAIHGEHSPLLFALTGGQGTGKTEFFRRLLPDEIKEYYAESKLDKEKDDEILMTQKILICDDEFGGKSKMEAKRLKELTSKEWFTLREPYGRKNVRLRRLAVLCGTSNEDMLLNDPTGNRRIIPLRVISIDHEKYNAIDKKKLFMEAYFLWSSGYDWRLSKDDVKLLSENTVEFEQIRTEQELLKRYLKHPDRRKIGESILFMQASEIKAHIEKITGQKLSIWKMGHELSELGFNQQSKKVNGSPRKGYNVILLNENSVEDIEEEKPADLPF